MKPQSTALLASIFFAVASTLSASTVNLASRPDAPMLEFASGKLAAALTAKGDALTHVPLAQAAAIVVIDTAEAALAASLPASLATEPGPDGFVLTHTTVHGTPALVVAGDPRGAMYGLLDVAEQLRSGIALDKIEPRTVRARLPFRAIKFNLPFSAYRTGPSIELHQATCKDPKFWEAFLDQMAENRFNSLTLWSLHPFHYFVVPKSFPEAQSFPDAELADWHKLWTQLFKMAKARGIETYLINWNTFVSPGFAKAHNIATYSIDLRHFGDGPKADEQKIVIDYTRECVKQIIDEYPDLTGLGITLGERMGSQSPQERRDWLDGAFFEGIAQASRPIKFIYRAPLSADKKSGGTTSEENDRLTRAQIEGLNKNILRPVYVEFKYNWSHGHSSPHLFIVHGGKLSDAYWNPLPTQFQPVWTVRNEDIQVLRWGEPGFIREFIENNGQPYVGGALVGSEVFIPALDYMSAEGPHKTWTYDFERKWMLWSMWGHLLHEPTTPDAHFATVLNNRFNRIDGASILKAWTLVSRVPLRFASFHQGTNDLSLYTEAFSSWGERGGAWRFFDIDNFIEQKVLDNVYVNIADFVKAGGQTAPGIISPLQLADMLDRDLDEAMKAVATVRAHGNITPTLDAELTDIDCWNEWGRYFAQKLRGGVALARFRSSGDKAEQAKAVATLEIAATHWRKLAELGTRFTKKEIIFHTAEPFSWARFLPAVEKDIATARAAQPSK